MVSHAELGALDRNEVVSALGKLTVREGINIRNAAAVIPQETTGDMSAGLSGRAVGVVWLLSGTLSFVPTGVSERNMRVLQQSICSLSPVASRACHTVCSEPPELTLLAPPQLLWKGPSFSPFFVYIFKLQFQKPFTVAAGFVTRPS